MENDTAIGLRDVDAQPYRLHCWLTTKLRRLQTSTRIAFTADQKSQDSAVRTPRHMAARERESFISDDVMLAGSTNQFAVLKLG